LLEKNEPGEQKTKNEAGRHKRPAPPLKGGGFGACSSFCSVLFCSK